MIDQVKMSPKGEPVRMIDATDFFGNLLGEEPICMAGEPFTRSNGTIIARIYERLTKASRRRISPADIYADTENEREEAYRRGVFDAFKALQEELSV